jgi:hypothetical protein
VAAARGGRADAPRGTDAGEWGETAAVPQVVVEARITDARWYLTCDPGVWPTVAVAHLTEQPTPLVADRLLVTIEAPWTRRRLLAPLAPDTAAPRERWIDGERWILVDDVWLEHDVAVPVAVACAAVGVDPETLADAVRRRCA